MSPMVEDWGIELAVKAGSFRLAQEALTKLLGYQVVDHLEIKTQRGKLKQTLEIVEDKKQRQKEKPQNIL